eukprot:TRINITY_DN70182_c0_g1_i1.p2 TRINITY_DN70182_c0_g1~~TRINITY_DN70182_c0_g1_i1.p2  ORF type:complete len:183 (+),score=66.18 TRINITY_DN70182_c0_g1_i1:86-634(+)
MSKQQGALSNFLLFAVPVYAMAVALQLDGPRGLMPTVDPAPTKPYATIAEFDPYYMSQHSDSTCQYLHAAGTTLVIAWLCRFPRLVPALLLGLSAGLCAFPLLRGLVHGFAEFSLVLAVYLVGAHYLTRRMLVAAVPLVIGYAFAWAGHFFFEKNKPATFVYPSYSLVMDFVLFARTLTGQL